MIITKECYDCKKEFSIREEDVFDGIVARPVKKRPKQYIEIWLCPKHRKDAIRGGTIYKEDITIVEEDHD